MAMIEKVARAIAEKDRPKDFSVERWWDIRGEDFTEKARAAIDAMKEPTERMLDAYWDQTGESILMRSRVHVRAQRMFAVMIDAALETTP